MDAPVLTVALVAHDGRKQDLLDWAEYNAGTLAGHKLVATGTTGALLADRLGRPVDTVLSGPLGGDQQIGSRIAEESVDLLIFFWDPLAAQPHDPDVRALLRLAVLHNTPVACNRSTADYLVSSPLFKAGYTGGTPDFDGHVQRALPGRLAVGAPTDG